VRDGRRDSTQGMRRGREIHDEVGALAGRKDDAGAGNGCLK